MGYIRNEGFGKSDSQIRDEAEQRGAEAYWSGYWDEYDYHVAAKSAYSCAWLDGWNKASKKTNRPRNMPT